MSKEVDIYSLALTVLDYYTAFAGLAKNLSAGVKGYWKGKADIL